MMGVALTCARPAIEGKRPGLREEGSARGVLTHGASAADEAAELLRVGELADVVRILDRRESALDLEIGQRDRLGDRSGNELDWHLALCLFVHCGDGGDEVVHDSLGQETSLRIFANKNRLAGRDNSARMKLGKGSVWIDGLAALDQSVGMVRTHIANLASVATDHHQNFHS